MASSPSNLPWLWVIEALASFEQVDASILIDLAKRIPEISASNLRMDEPEMLKWDLQTFVMHKRACLPICTLQQLKDAILEGNHPILASLKEKGGLSINNQSENRIPVDENLDGLVRGNSANQGFLPSKRDRIDLDTENQVVGSHEDPNDMDNGCVPHLPSTKKLKKNATFTNQAVCEESVVIIEDEQETVREGSELDKTYLMGSSVINGFSEKGHNQTITSEKSGLKNHADDAGLQTNNHAESSCKDNNTLPQDTFEDGAQQDLPVNEAKEGNNCAEKETSNGPNQNNIGCDGSQLNASSDNDGYHPDEKIGDVALKKLTILSSQCTFTEDSLASAELNFCIKCSKSGDLLVCSASACPFVAHQSCLGASAPNFDDSGNFYCPFCAYSRAILEYLETQKKASIARKDLVAFIGSKN